MIQSLTGYWEYCLDRFIVENQFFKIFHQRVNWKNPQTLAEKMQILKIDPEAKKMWIYTDRHQVREYVKKSVGGKHLIKLLGVFGNPEAINIDSLPKRFVLKTTHGSGQIIICKNKSDLNWQKTKEQLRKWLQTNYYKKFREKSYQLIKPRIICEKYMEDKNGNLFDYKLFCFHGRPRLIQVDLDRYTNHTQNFYTPGWKKIPMARCFPVFKKKLPKPKYIKKMLQIATILAKPFPHVRVDLYSVDNKIYFGEMTFTSFAGYPVFKPNKYNYILGQYLQLKA
jgi:hypothetical protein